MNFLGQPKQENPAQQQLKGLLFDDNIQVLSSFELNKVASLTYGDTVCDQIFEMIEHIVAQPMAYTPLAIQKALVVTKHIVVFGSEKCVNHTYGIGGFIEKLHNFNTVLMTQGAMAMWNRIQGGGVDLGGPVREAAIAVSQLLGNIDELKRIRNSSADPNSLVPIGDDKVAFVTDEVRHYLLRKRIEEQQRLEIKSNLQKSEGGWGGGYSSKDGKVVVGAAHGIEEMLKIASKKKQHYTDDGQPRSGCTPEEEAILAELAAEAAAAKTPEVVDFLSAHTSSASAPPNSAGAIDFLDFGSGSAVSTSAHVQSTGDLLGGTSFLGGSSLSSQPSDPFGLAANQPHHDPFGSSSGASDFLSLASSMATAAAVDPFGLTSPSLSAAAPASNLLGTSSANSMPGGSAPGSALGSSSVGNITSAMTGMSMTNDNSAPQKKSVMSSNLDRFAALDELAAPVNPVTTLDAKSAENRLLSMTSSSMDTLKANTTAPSTSDPLAMYGASYGSNTASTSTSIFSPSGMTSLPSPPPPSYLMGMPEPALPTAGFIAPGSGSVATTYNESVDAEENPWVMGGTTGAGLQPLAPAPGAPPPQPP